MASANSNYADLVEVIPPTEGPQGNIDAERSLWATIQSQKLKTAYLKAYSTSYDRFQLASTAMDVNAMVRQVDAMVKFADLALQASRIAALKWHEFERFSINELEKVQASVAEKGIPWEKALEGWFKSLQTEGPSAKLREVLIAAQSPAAEIEPFKKQFQTFTPTDFQEMIAALKVKIEGITLVRNKLSAMKSQASWPEPADIARLEHLQRNARHLLQQVLRTRIILSPDPTGKAPLAWWAIPTGSPSWLRKESAFEEPKSESLAPGAYDIYIIQDQENLNWPIPLAVRIAREIQVTEGHATELHLQTGLRIEIAEGFPEPQSWFVMPSDTVATSIIAQRAEGSLDALWLPPGQYDVYWVGDYEHRNNPLLVASGVKVPDKDIVTLSLESGIRLEMADWVSERDPNWGWWGAVRAGKSSDQRVNWSHSNDPLLLVPGQYDVYWVQDDEHKDKPLLLAKGVEVKANETTTIPANSGIRLEMADWVPERDPNWGWWGAVPTGKSSDQRVNWSHSNDPLLLVPGQYDVYWVQDDEHKDKPLTLAKGMEVKNDTLITIPAKSGLKLKVPANTPALDPNWGWWGVVPTGGKIDERIHWAKGKLDEALLVLPGTYDIAWKQDNHHQPTKIKQGIIIKDNELVEAKVSPGKPE